MQEKCSVKGCDRKSEVKKHKLCRTHYMRYKLKGDVGEGKIKKRIPLIPYFQTLQA